MIACFSLIPATFHWYWDDHCGSQRSPWPHGPMAPWPHGPMAHRRPTSRSVRSSGRRWESWPWPNWPCPAAAGSPSRTMRRRLSDGVGTPARLGPSNEKIGEKVANTEANHVSRSTQESLPKSITIAPNEPWPEPFFQVTELILRGARHGRSCCRLRLRRLRCLRRLRSGSALGRVRAPGERPGSWRRPRWSLHRNVVFCSPKSVVLLYWTPFLIKILKP